MYTKNRPANIPPNYGGSIFGRRDANVHFTPDGKPPAPESTETLSVPASEDAERTSDSGDSKRPSILSPIGALGTEELLLIAIALIVFQGGKQPDLALILLALLFIN